MNVPTRGPASLAGRPTVLFWLLALTNVFVGAMVGLERTVIPILAEQDFGLRAGATVGGFIIAFAVAKAVVNLFAGQALAWSMTVNMMVDLMPPRRRGFAAGINEFAGYFGLSATAFLTGLIAVVADRVPAAARATALGVYRFFRDGGYAVGALIGGLGLVSLVSVTAWTGVAFVPLAGVSLATLEGRITHPESDSNR